jgi:uncharacterized protein (UPF0332 family)
MTLADELRAMLDKAERYVASAELLHAQGDYDSAISRLYYAMFYCAEALLTAEGLAYSSHKAVIAAFGQHFAKTGKLPSSMHQWLREGFEKRQISDYDFVLTVREDDVIDLSGKAQQFITATASFLKEQGHL